MILSLLFILPFFFGLSHLFTGFDSMKKIAFWIFAFLQGSLLFLSFGIESPFILQVGNWPHYAGITWLFDDLSRLFILVSFLIFLPTLWISLSRKIIETSLLYFLLGSLIGAFLTADLFNLFVMYEVFLMASYALFFGVRRLKAAKLYIWANVVGSVLFLFAIAYVYRAVGSVSMSVLASQMPQLSSSQQSLLYLSLCLIFFLKAGLWPLLMWMPSSYPRLPTHLLAFIGALLTKVGLYSFVRLSSWIGPTEFQNHQVMFSVIAILSIFFPLLGALGSRSIKAAFTYFGLSHVGLLFYAFLQGGALGTEAFLFYFLHDAIIMAGLFFFVRDYERAGSPDGIFRRSKKATLAFLFLALAASGLPPLGGFWGEWLILRASFPSAISFTVVLGTTFLSLFLMLQIWDRHFVAPAQKSGTKKFRISTATYYCMALSVVVAFLGISHRDIFQGSAIKVWSMERVQETIQNKTTQTDLNRQTKEPNSP